MRLLLIALSLLLVITLMPTTSFAQPQDLYVNPMFDPSVSGWGTTHFSSVQDAIDSAGELCTIHLLSGIYDCSTQEFPIYVREKEMFIEGGVTIDATGSDSAVFVVKSGAIMHLDSCTITGGIVGVHIMDAAALFSHVTIAGNSYVGIIARSVFGDARADIASAKLLDNGNGIITMSICKTSLAVTCTNTLISGSGNGISSFSLQKSETIVVATNNTISNNSGTGIVWRTLFGASLDMMATNNIITSNEGHGIDGYGINNIFSHNNVWGNSLGNYAYADLTKTDGNMSKDPLFAGNGDYRLTIYSPCIDAGIDATTRYPGQVVNDCNGVPRPQGKEFDCGAYESGRVTILQLSDLHLLAPLGDDILYGKAYDTYIWDNAAGFVEGINGHIMGLGLVTDAIVVTGDMVNWATESDSYKTILWQEEVHPEWERTYLGYEAFKSLLQTEFGNVPIYDTVGNHDYREHPFYLWTWLDDEGIGQQFIEAMNYSPLTTIDLSEALGMQCVDPINIVLLNTGHDNPINTNPLENQILPFLIKNTKNYDEIYAALGNAPLYSSIIESIGKSAYGSGFYTSQIEELDAFFRAWNNTTNLIYCHYPVVYAYDTVSYNIGPFLELCMAYDVPYVFSGHIHQNSPIYVEWENGSTTNFNIVGAAYDGHYSFVTYCFGSVPPGQEYAYVII